MFIYTINEAGQNERKETTEELAKILIESNSADFVKLHNETEECLATIQYLKQNGYEQCDFCGGWNREEDMETVTMPDDIKKNVCMSCIGHNQKIYSCDECGEYFYSNEPPLEIEDSSGWDVAICPRCESGLDTATCSNCGARIFSSQANTTDDGETYCDRCYEERYVECEECGKMIPRGEEQIINRAVLCSDCVEARECEGFIRSHDYKPQPIFTRAEKETDSNKLIAVKEEYAMENTLYMGVELEIGTGGCNNRNAYILANIVNKGEAGYDSIYAKNDGSVHSGFELVTQPCTLEVHKNIFGWNKLCQKATSMGYLSHNDSTCGLHVHINKNFLGKTEMEIEDTISSMILFIENNWEDVVKFSRRSGSCISQWAGRYKNEAPQRIQTYIEQCKEAKTKRGIYSVGKEYCREHGRRYKAVNVTNRNTVEFRFFRGTLKTNSIIASLQMVDLLVKITKLCSAFSVERASFKTIRRLAQKYNYIELLKYMDERSMYTNINPYKPYLKTIKEIIKDETNDANQPLEEVDTGRN